MNNEPEKFKQAFESSSGGSYLMLAKLLIKSVYLLLSQDGLARENRQGQRQVKYIYCIRVVVFDLLGSPRLHVSDVRYMLDPHVRRGKNRASILPIVYKNFTNSL